MSATPTNGTRHAWRGRLAFYHPTASGGGAAARIEFSPPRSDREGCCFLELAKQKTAAGRDAAGRQTATFDWESKLTVKLGFADICSLLLVLEGRGEQAGNGRGLFHDTAEANAVINLRRQAEPAGYVLEVSRKLKRGDAEVQRVRLLLAEAEALGMRVVFQAALFPMVFGLPVETAAAREDAAAVA
jgi:hypothetical protein